MCAGLRCYLRVMVIRVGVGLAAAVGLAACGGAAVKGGAAAPVRNVACTDVATRLAEPQPGMTPSADAVAEMAALFEARCDQDAWSDAARRCIVDAAPSETAYLGCGELLTSDQVDAVSRAMQAYLAVEDESPDRGDRVEGECYDCGDAEGDPDGVEGGVAEGSIGAAPPPPPPPPPPPATKVVAPTVLEALRISGEKNIVPDYATKMAIARSNTRKLMGVYKLCLAASGSIQSVSMIKSMGFAAYDTKIQTTMRTWKYRPFMLDGMATPVCTVVQFAYSQVDPDADAAQP